MLKVELHSHTADDPIDPIPYSTPQFIDRAAELKYDAVAITLHDRQLDIRPLADYARERGITLIPGIERTIQGKHVLLLNFRRGAEEVNSFEDLAELRRQDPAGLVIAPHPFFPHSNCLRGLLEQHADLFDAVEWNAMFTKVVNFNRAAESWARRHRKPLVGNGDVHRLRQLGTTYSLIDADRDAGSICRAVREGRVRVEATPLTTLQAASIVGELLRTDLARALAPVRREPEYSVR